MTALTFAAAIDDAGRFTSSRAAGAYLGLTSRRYQSGEMDYVRRAHPLKDWGRRIARRPSHKKACVALARRLAVIMHRMLISGEALRKTRPQPGRQPRRAREVGCKTDKCPSNASVRPGDMGNDLYLRHG